MLRFSDVENLRIMLEKDFEIIKQALLVYLDKLPCPYIFRSWEHEKNALMNEVFRTFEDISDVLRTYSSDDVFDFAAWAIIEELINNFELEDHKSKYLDAIRASLTDIIRSLALSTTNHDALANQADIAHWSRLMSAESAVEKLTRENLAAGKIAQKLHQCIKEAVDAPRFAFSSSIDIYAAVFAYPSGQNDNDDKTPVATLT